MRKNLPVIDIEEHFPEQIFLISKTDTKGIITYANRDFCRLSGFLFEELLGKPHNILRHLDMPSSIFEGMWKQIQTGCEWHGIIKNRCKNGHFYWVDATVTPVYNQHQQLAGYISVRRQPALGAVELAAAEYRQLLDHNTSFSGGHIDGQSS